MSIDDLPPQKRKYVKGLAAGKTKTDAALDAGYALSTAKNAKSHIETPNVREAFAALIRQRIPAEKIAQRMEEGLDAMETKFFQKDGKVEDERDVIAWSERRQYAQLAAEYGGFFTPKSEIDIDLTADVYGWTDEQLRNFVESGQRPDGTSVAALTGNSEDRA